MERENNAARVHILLAEFQPRRPSLCCHSPRESGASDGSRVAALFTDEAPEALSGHRSKCSESLLKAPNAALPNKSSTLIAEAVEAQGGALLRPPGQD